MGRESWRARSILSVVGSRISHDSPACPPLPCPSIWTCRDSIWFEMREQGFYKVTVSDSMKSHRHVLIHAMVRAVDSYKPLILLDRSQPAAAAATTTTNTGTQSVLACTDTHPSPTVAGQDFDDLKGFI